MLGSAPSGRLCAAKVASATSVIAMPLSVPLTVNRPPENSRSSALASSRCAAKTFALSITLSAARTRASPPTTSDREP